LEKGISLSQSAQLVLCQGGLQRKAFRLRMTEHQEPVMKNYLAIVPVAGLLLMGAAVPSFAAKPGEAQEQDVLQSKQLTLTQAIATAEQLTGGKAFDAGTDVDNGKPRVVVETNGAKGVQTVIIDADNGQIMSTHAGGESD
jgi:hypothetical protein